LSHLFELCFVDRAVFILIRKFHHSLTILRKLVLGDLAVFVLVQGQQALDKISTATTAATRTPTTAFAAAWRSRQFVHGKGTVFVAIEFHQGGGGVLDLVGRQSAVLVGIQDCHERVDGGRTALATGAALATGTALAAGTALTTGAALSFTTALAFAAWSLSHRNCGDQQYHRQCRNTCTDLHSIHSCVFCGIGFCETDMPCCLTAIGGTSFLIGTTTKYRSRNYCPLVAFRSAKGTCFRGAKDDNKRSNTAK
jgi:hypothetical protein